MSTRKTLSFYFLFLLISISFLAGSNVYAEEQPVNPEATVSLVSNVDSISHKDDSILLGIHFILPPDYKIFWRTPGIAGKPPRFNWGGTQNATIEKVFWPYPYHFTVFDIYAAVYKNEVLFPVIAKIHDPQKKVHIALSVSYLLCSAEDCIPLEKKLSLDLFHGFAKQTSHAELIHNFINKVPKTEAHIDLNIDNIEMSHGADNIPQLSVVVNSLSGFKDPSLFIEGPNNVYFTQPKAEIKKNSSKGSFMIKAYKDENKDAKPSVNLLHQPVKLTLVDKGTALEATRIIISPSSAFWTTFYIILVAFLGGIILNFMPCVLPILFIKFADIIDDKISTRHEIRYNFIITALGILTSFLVLAIVAILFKWFGAAFMWGTQFQQPLFLIIMSIILTVFACNLWGLFEIGHFRTISSKIVSKKARNNTIEQFSKGVFATLLATPCSAPFVGTALSFALSRGAWEILAIFFSLGIGFASPYLLVSFYPGIKKYVPKPGRWMLTLQHILGGIVILTVAWLFFVLYAQVNMNTLYILVIALLLIIQILFIGHSKPKIPRFIIWAGIILVISGTLIAHYMIEAPREAKIIQDTKALWKPFELKSIPKLINQDKIVFVDVTARWCLTCYVNKTMVLNNPMIKHMLMQKNVIAMRADWSNYSQEISSYLRTFNRYAIPFNVIYSKKYPKGIVLPELLTKGSVQKAMKKAGYVEPKNLSSKVVNVAREQRAHRTYSRKSSS